jgi:glycosyltransferase involved in cell wall biosynthesis
MAKIVIDAREFTTSTGRYMFNLVKYLESTDNTNQYIILLKPSDAKNWQPTAPNFKVVTTKYKEFSFGEQLGLAWQLYRLRPNLVHFGMVQQPLLYFGRSVTTMHDLTTTRFKNPTKNSLIFSIKQQVYKLVNKWAVRKNKFIITPTNYVKKDIINYTKIRADKIVVTYESADKINDKAMPVKQLIAKEYIMYVGRPQPHKNLANLISAFANLKQNHPKLKLVIAGKKDIAHNAYIQQAKKLNVSKDVIFSGFVSEGQLRWLYEHTAGYVFPSFSEGFGLPGLEAMVHGAPVISSNATCLPEVYGDGAVYFNPHNVDDIAKKIDIILSNYKTRDDLIKKGYANAKKYSWLKMANQTIEVYNKALK